MDRVPDALNPQTALLQLTPVQAEAGVSRTVAHLLLLLCAPRRRTKSTIGSRGVPDALNPLHISPQGPCMEVLPPLLKCRWNVRA